MTQSKTETLARNRRSPWRPAPTAKERARGGCKSARALAEPQHDLRRLDAQGYRPPRPMAEHGGHELTDYRAANSSA
ncbi:hypothetical protein TNCV_4597011 [Trichonephila clavipes]|nr:hypothetical protein TNIN_361831 [Trichonephila inaurata madagascariensis]GFY33993.1 hypothetical protein TNCV_4597011 [Trichonephila clavipes]GFY51809.1 hypothetical protein TNIN_115551 [Trichonephila inaurata madagascariensis]